MTIKHKQERLLNDESIHRNNQSNNLKFRKDWFKICSCIWYACLKWKQIRKEKAGSCYGSMGKVRIHQGWRNLFEAT